MKINKYKLFSLLMLLNLNWFVALVVLQSNNEYQLKSTNTSIKLTDLTDEIESGLDNGIILNKIDLTGQIGWVNEYIIIRDISVNIFDNKLFNQYFTLIKSLNLIV